MFNSSRHLRRGLAFILLASASGTAFAELPEHPVVHVFTPTNEEIVAPDGSPVDTRFGSAVAIRNNTAVIAMAGISKVAVFQRTTAGWTRSAELRPPEPAVNYGWGVAYRDNTIVVSSQQALYVYKLVNGAWRYVSKLMPPAGDVMGNRPHTLTLQDNIVAMGYTHEDGRGSVYVYELSSTGQLSRRVKLQPADSASNDVFGADVAMSTGTLVIGSPGNGGAAYIFKRTSTGWRQFQKLMGTNSFNEGFGESVAINNGVVVIGAPTEDPEGLQDPGTGPIAMGAAFVFLPSASGAYVERQRIRPTAEESDNFELFGRSIYMSGDKLAVGGRTWVGGSGVYRDALLFTYTLTSGRATSRGVAVFDELEWSGSFANNWLLIGEEYPDCRFDACIGQAKLFDVNRLK